MLRGALCVVAGCSRSAPPPEPLANTTPTAATNAWRDLPSDAYDVSLATGAEPQLRCAGGVIARMTALSADGDRMIVTLGAGRANGIGREWSVRLTRPEIEARLVRVERGTSIAVIAAPSSTNMSPYFELCPP